MVSFPVASSLNLSLRLHFYMLSVKMVNKCLFVIVWPQNFLKQMQPLQPKVDSKEAKPKKKIILAKTIQSFQLH